MTVIEKEAAVDLQAQLIRRAWEDKQFANLLKTNPRVAIAEETGVELPEGVRVCVHQEDETTLHLVLPKANSPEFPEVPDMVATGPTAGVPCDCVTKSFLQVVCTTGMK